MASVGWRSRAWRWFERAVIGAGMGMAAWVIERRLLKALKRGSVEAAPRTAAGSAGDGVTLPVELPRQGEVS